MKIVIYVRQTDKISIYEQYNKCADYCRLHGYSISGKVLDFDGKHFHDAINKVIADSSIAALMIYNKDFVFSKYDDYLFYKIYLEKLGKTILFYN